MEGLGHAAGFARPASAVHKKCSVRSSNQNSSQPGSQSRTPGDSAPALDIPPWVHGLTEPDRGYMIEVGRRAPSLLAFSARQADTPAMSRLSLRGSAPFTASLGALKTDALGDLGPVGRVNEIFDCMQFGDVLTKGRT